MKQFSQDEILEYWSLVSSRCTNVDFIRDPDGLSIVCGISAPPWLNQYYAKFQRQVFEKLFSFIEFQSGTKDLRALDIGCGAGRWCRFLAEHGYNTTGIDLQEELIAINSVRYRDYHNCIFYHSSIQDFEPESAFDLICSITVIQHIPAEEQKIVINKLRSLLNLGGYCIIMENLKHQAIHLWSKKVASWKRSFEQAGFRTIAVQYYDYSPFLRTYSLFENLYHRLDIRRGKKEINISPEMVIEGYIQRRKQRSSTEIGSIARDSLRFVPMCLDYLIEPMLIRQNLPLPTLHCGFLFKAV